MSARHIPHQIHASLLIDNQAIARYLKSTLLTWLHVFASKFQVIKLKCQNSDIIWNYNVLRRVTPARQGKVKLLDAAVYQNSGILYTALFISKG